VAEFVLLLAALLGAGVFALERLWGGLWLYTELHRLILEYKPNGNEVRVLYKHQDGTNPRTVIRRWKVLDLVRRSLQQTLKALDIGDAVDLGSSTFSTREDARFVLRLKQCAGSEGRIAWLWIRSPRR
jgi:hypothetical protein